MAAGMNDEPTGEGAEAPEAGGTLPAVRRTRAVLWVAVAVSVPLVVLVVVLGSRIGDGAKSVDSPLLGKPAPEIEAETIDGDTVRLTDFEGQWVVVNFFATWCVPCREEHPDLVAFHERHRATGDATVLGVVFDDSVGAVREFRAAEGGEWPMLVDPGGRIALDLGVAGVPESFLVSPDGIVVSRVLGGVRLADLDRLLAEAKAQRP